MCGKALRFVRSKQDSAIKIKREGGIKIIYKAENFSIFHPSTVILQRSVKKRLNSIYCKKYKNSLKCQT